MEETLKQQEAKIRALEDDRSSRQEQVVEQRRQLRAREVEALTTARAVFPEGMWTSVNPRSDDREKSDDPDVGLWTWTVSQGDVDANASGGGRIVRGGELTSRRFDRA